MARFYSLDSSAARPAARTGRNARLADKLNACMDHDTLSRVVFRTGSAAFCDAPPVGGKFAHRATHVPTGSSLLMKLVNPPEAFMLTPACPYCARSTPICRV